MGLDGDQGCRDRGTAVGKVGHVSRRRRKAESQLGRGEFGKPWAEREKERGVRRKEEETGRRRESAGSTGLVALLSCSLCS